MTTMTAHDLNLSSWLQRHKNVEATLTLTRAQVHSLQLELSQLQQSNAMLRKQNRKLRGRLGAPLDEDSASDSAGALDDEAES